MIQQQEYHLLQKLLLIMFFIQYIQSNRVHNVVTSISNHYAKAVYTQDWYPRYQLPLKKLQEKFETFYIDN